jgi:hypothetical protein
MKEKGYLFEISGGGYGEGCVSEIVLGRKILKILKN